MPLLRNRALKSHPQLTRRPQSDREWRDFVLALDEQEVDSIIVREDGFIRSGQTDYDTGTGWWIGDDAGTPKFSIGDSSGDKLTWDGSQLTVSGQIELGNIQTFTPGWVGFSTDPTGDCNYIDMGTFALIWPNTVNSQFVGTSDSNSMFLTGIPAEIRPAGGRISPIRVFDGAGDHIGLCLINDDGEITFAMGVVSGSSINIDGSGFETSGIKGWAGTIIYPL